MDRRNFIKHLAATAAMASLAGRTGVAQQAPKGKNRQSAPRTLVFISDLHMNVDADYSWFSDHAGPLAGFLDSINNRGDVTELIILGDLLDNWVTPVTDPVNSFADVLAAAANGPVIAALQDVCANPAIDVTYVTGNHDMLSFDSLSRGLIGNTFPGMTIISNEPGLGAYSKNNIIWAEHGHRYCLFNAPDTWSRPNSHLPLGYFISRLAASKSVADQQVHTTPDVLDYFLKLPDNELRRMPAISGNQVQRKLKKGVVDDALIIAVYEAIALWAGVPLWDRYHMGGLDKWAPDPFVAAIGVVFDKIFSCWPDRQNIVSNLEAVLDDIGRLSGPANLLFEMPPWLKKRYPFTPRIVLFGHTHKAALQYHSEGNGTIYANTGTWIDSSPMSWVEVHISGDHTNEHTYTVALWFMGENGPRQQASITVPY